MTAAMLPPAESPATMIGTSAPAIVGELRVHPFECRVRVVDRDRVAVLGGQPVVDEDDCAARPVGKLASERVELVDVAADDPSAAVVVDEDAARRRGRDEHACGDAFRPRPGSSWSSTRSISGPLPNSSARPAVRLRTSSGVLSAIGLTPDAAISVRKAVSASFNGMVPPVLTSSKSRSKSSRDIRSSV